MKQVKIIRETKKVVIVETNRRVFTLEVMDKNGNWLAKDADGKLYSNNHEAIYASLQKDASDCNDWTAFCLANGYLRIIKDKGIVQV